MDSSSRSLEAVRKMFPTSATLIFRVDPWTMPAAHATETADDGDSSDSSDGSDDSSGAPDPRDGSGPSAPHGAHSNRKRPGECSGSLLADRAPTGRGLLLPPLRLEAVRLHPCEARPLPVAFSIAAHHHRLTAVFEALLPAAKLSTPSLVSFLALPAPIGETYQLPVLPGGALQRSYVGDPVHQALCKPEVLQAAVQGVTKRRALLQIPDGPTHSPEAHSRCTWGSGAAAYAHHTSAMGFRSGSRGTCKVGFPDFGSRCCA